MSRSEECVLQLWPKKAPGAQGSDPEDIPTLEVFLPPRERATGAAIIICPGGGYVIHAEHEATPVATWLASNGIASFVLRYRLGPRYHHPIQLKDAQRAIRFVRAHAADWQVDPARVGILGFSAGGHLVSMTATHFDSGNARARDPIERLSSRPDMQLMVYPVITLAPNYSSWWNVLDRDPAIEVVDFFCTERHVTPETPPAFLAHSVNDIGVPVLNSDVYAASLAAAGVPFTYVREDMGDHGYGMHEKWTLPCLQWLRTSGFSSPFVPTG